MGGKPSKAESAYKETQLSEFAAQYKNSDMPQLQLFLDVYGRGSVITNTSDMPAALDAIGNISASLQVPLELKDNHGRTLNMTTKTLGPFSEQVFKLGKFEERNKGIYETAVSDALEALGWKFTSTRDAYTGGPNILIFMKVGDA
jgi:hypothetical protein